ncbi:hypothetical protein SB00610_01544 [Klebsiella quasipneumoniae subsp. similipneumoniae]|nr:hypothetical protein SB00610_01544 [Klebsiella quasipneumoniae subsp. similipneumoniae]
MINSEKVTCSSGRPTPSLAARGFVSSVQTYCGLEMAAIQIKPSTSWRHLSYFGVTNGSLSVVMLFSVFS